MSLIVILGPTAVGKTKLATHLAKSIHGELISADSRQVYKGMDIGTGKDLEDFTIGQTQIPYHLIDIKEAGEEYNLFNFQQDFFNAYQTIVKSGRSPILCGGSGLYLEAALAEEKMLEVPMNEHLRKELALLPNEELNETLITLKPGQHNTTDLEDRQRTIRAIEIEQFKKECGDRKEKSPVKDSIVFGLDLEREKLRARIKDRLEKRLASGMIEEVEQLIERGISNEMLYYYGLEYRFIGMFLNGSISKQQMFDDLLQAIRRFAKKQMTWYRRMEKKGTVIHWINAELSLEEKLEQVQQHLHYNQ